MNNIRPEPSLEQQKLTLNIMTGSQLLYAFAAYYLSTQEKNTSFEIPLFLSNISPEIIFYGAYLLGIIIFFLGKQIVEANTKEKELNFSKKMILHSLAGMTGFIGFLYSFVFGLEVQNVLFWATSIAFHIWLFKKNTEKKSTF